MNFYEQASLLKYGSYYGSIKVHNTGPKVVIDLNRQRPKSANTHILDFA